MISRVFGFEVTGLILSPCKSCVFCKLCMVLKTIDISNLGHDPGREDRANAQDGYQNILVKVPFV